MCKDCGCELPGENPIGFNFRQHPDEHEHGHGHEDHGHSHEHHHEHGPGEHHGQSHAHMHFQHDAQDESHDEPRRVIQVRQAILSKNDRIAERNRRFFRARGLFAINVLSSPGSGKTTFVYETVRLLKGRLKSAIIVGDLATDNDARRLGASGAPVVQITTGTMCHLEAEMIARSVQQLALDDVQLLVIENVGNLVCPAAYDLGEDFRVVLFSVTEGEDKPLKYPPMFQAADVVVISKIDLTSPCNFDRGVAMEAVRRTAPKARVFEVSARTGAGMDSWAEFLVAQHSKVMA
jgi:hydrogenase nickel incorporation protein HypB